MSRPKFECSLKQKKSSSYLQNFAIPLCLILSKDVVLFLPIWKHITIASSHIQRRNHMLHAQFQTSSTTGNYNQSFHGLFQLTSLFFSNHSNARERWQANYIHAISVIFIALHLFYVIIFYYEEFGFILNGYAQFSRQENHGILQNIHTSSLIYNSYIITYDILNESLSRSIFNQQ